MNATDLIKLLREHPKACERLKITVNEHQAGVWQVSMFNHGAAYSNAELPMNVMRVRFLGAAQEWCDEKDIVIVKNEHYGFEWRRYTKQPDTWHELPKVMRGTTGYSTRLACCLAAIEAHEA